MKVSIALCTFNGAPYLREQLESFAAQERLPDELVVGDDGSCDGSIQIIEDFSKHAKFPVHIHVNGQKLGVVRNFDETINRCSGDVIFTSDQDDVWMDEKIRLMVSEFEKDPDIGLVFSDAIYVDEDLGSLGYTV